MFDTSGKFSDVSPKMLMFGVTDDVTGHVKICDVLPFSLLEMETKSVNQHAWIVSGTYHAQLSESTFHVEVFQGHED